MTTITLKVCEHCDARDVIVRDGVTSPEVLLHDIASVEIKITSHHISRWDRAVDLCLKCREELQANIITATSQKPVAAK